MIFVVVVVVPFIGHWKEISFQSWWFLKLLILFLSLHIIALPQDVHASTSDDFFYFVLFIYLFFGRFSVFLSTELMFSLFLFPFSLSLCVHKHTYRSENGDADSDEPTTCCKLCKCCTPCYASALCLPCRRLKKLSCCNRAKKLSDEQKATEIATSILHESEKKASASADAAAESCWKRLKCCNRKSKQAANKMMDEVMTMEDETARKVTATAAAAGAAVAKERGKCALCLAKVFCCRKTNKIQTSNDGTTTGNESDEENGSRCCSCLPCRRKKKEPMAWSERRQDSLTSTENIPKK